MHDESKSNETEGPYRYGNTRPFTVFALALGAAIGAVAVVGAAWSSLDSATEKHQLATPPDLKSVVEKTGAKGRALIEGLWANIGDDTTASEDRAELASADDATAS